MMDTTPRLHHPAVEQAIAAYGQLGRALERPDLMQKIATPLERYRMGLFRLVVVGEEKRGKSSFVNALLEEEGLAPVGIEATTSTVFKIAYGPKTRYRVFFLPEDPDRPDETRRLPLEVGREEVAAYGSETGNPGNAKGVDFIAVEHPHRLLKAGLVIVDLPGLGGLMTEHALITRRYLPNADAAFFLVDSTSAVLNREEVATFELLRGYTGHIIVVQTKIDAVGKLQWESWRDRNLQIIEEKLQIAKRDLPYFPVSSTLKHLADQTSSAEDLADSGFVPLLKLLDEDLIARKHDRLAAPVLTTMANEMEAITRLLESDIAILSTESQGALDRLQAELKAAQQTYEGWKQRDLPGVLKGFNQEFDQAYDDTVARIQRDLDPSSYGPIVGRIMGEVEKSGVGAKQIADEAATFNNAVVATCGDIMGGISGDFDRRIYAAYDDAAREIGHAARPILIRRGDVASNLTFEHVDPKVRGSIIDIARQGQSGLMLGASVAAIAASIIFPPLSLGMMVIAFMGGLFGARRSIADAQARQRDQVIQQLRNLLTDTVRRTQQQCRYELDKSTRRTRQDMLGGLNEAVTTRDREERSALAAIGERRRQSREESTARLKLEHDKLAAAGRVGQLMREAGFGGASASSSTRRPAVA
jgi:GTP-binding protein EngB required for normal cell division